MESDKIEIVWIFEKILVCLRILLNQQQDAWH